MIVEMAGRPAAHLTESLEKHVSILRDVSDAEVHEIKVSTPKVIPSEVGSEQSVVGSGKDEREDMFTAFAECDFEMPSFARLSETMFDFMPSSVEVIEPSTVNLDMSEATDLLNNISGRMHRYDEIAKIAGEGLRQMDAQLKAMHAALIERDAKIAELSGKSEVGSRKSDTGSAKKTIVKKKTKKVVTRNSTPSELGTKVPSSSGKKK